MNPFYGSSGSPFFNVYQSDDPGLSLDPNFTTVMLRNIPNKYTAKMLLDVLDKRFAKQYDYVYLPVDFVNHCNVGYAFINLRGYETRIKFYKHFHNQKVKDVLPGFNSKKVLKQVCEVNKAKVQGAKENIRRIRQMNMLMQRLKEHPEWVPLIFDADGKAIPLDLDGVTEAEERILEKSSSANSVLSKEHDYAPSSYGMYNNNPAVGAGAGAYGAAAASWEHSAAAQPYYAAYQQHQQQVFEQIMAYSQAHAAYQSALQSAASYATNVSPPSQNSDQSANPYEQNNQNRVTSGGAPGLTNNGAAPGLGGAPGLTNGTENNMNNSSFATNRGPGVGGFGGNNTNGPFPGANVNANNNNYNNMAMQQPPTGSDPVNNNYQQAKRVSNSTAAKSPYTSSTYTSSTMAGTSPLETPYYNKQEMIMGDWNYDANNLGSYQ